jgi:hypothetical protein
MSYHEQLEKRCSELEEQLIIAKQHENDEINDLFIRYLAVTIQAAIEYKAKMAFGAGAYGKVTDQEKRDTIYKKVKLIKVLQDKSRDFNTTEMEDLIKQVMKDEHIIP